MGIVLGSRGTELVFIMADYLDLYGVKQTIIVMLDYLISNCAAHALYDGEALISSSKCQISWTCLEWTRSVHFVLISDFHVLNS